jgi:glycosyltransferase involved in cell wall biosynthesis
LKVLIITYYWPPAGGSGVQRWLKFVKYFQEFGIEPIVYTVENTKYIKEDKSLLKEVPKDINILKQTIWQPEQLLFWKKAKQNNNQVATLTQNRILSFIRGNFFIPDPKVFWVKKSVRFLENIIKENNIDTIISTGPPHSMHLIGLKLKRKLDIPWLADFRDPWANLYYNSDFNYSSIVKNIHKKLESKVLQQADVITTVSNSLKGEFKKSSKNVKVVTNGFDNEVLTDNKNQLDRKFSISYIGLLPKQSNPDLFFKVLKTLTEKDKDFKKDLQVNFVGDIAKEVISTVKKYQLEDYVSFKGYVSHDEAIKIQQKSQVLLLLIPNVKSNKGILTGKLFEYITTKRPILAFGPEGGDLDEILNNTNTGSIVNYDDEHKISAEVLGYYSLYKKNELKAESTGIMRFHRKELTKQMSKILKELTK